MDILKVFGQPRCVQCKMTKRFLDEQNIQYKYIDVSQNEKELNYIKELGFSSLPVVEYGQVRFSGFRPNSINSLFGFD